MSFDSDVALIGTGLAPLIAAKALIAEGKSVLLLNPDFDFFHENSELPLDPLSPIASEAFTAERIRKSTFDAALKELRPDFPGPLETWPRQAVSGNFQDTQAPHVRSRTRLWMAHPSNAAAWERIEELYVEASDLDLKPQISDGLIACKKFPGVSSRASGGDYRGVSIPRLIDVDVSRYRNGILEFVRDRMPPERLVRAASQIEFTPEGLRFYSGGTAHTARLRESALVFWTPRLTNWILAQAKRFDAKPDYPKAVRLWEEWSLMSRELLDPNVVGVIDDMTVWAEVEGVPTPNQLNRLAVLRAGPEMSVDSPPMSTWASAESFEALSRLCREFLKWDKFSVRSLRARAIFEWESEGLFLLNEMGNYRANVVKACDGALFDVLRAAHQACGSLGGAE